MEKIHLTTDMLNGVSGGAPLYGRYAELDPDWQAQVDDYIRSFKMAPDSELAELGVSRDLGGLMRLFELGVGTSVSPEDYAMVEAYVRSHY